MSKIYRWKFSIEEISSPSIESSNCPKGLTSDNREIWLRYICKRIDELMTDTTMQEPAFREIEEMVNLRQQQQMLYDKQQERQRQKRAERRERRRSMESPKITFIPDGLTICYEEEYGRFLKQEVEFMPTCLEDYQYQLRLIERWYTKSVPQLIAMGRPDAAFGVSMALCKVLPQYVFRADINEVFNKKKPRLCRLLVGAFEGLVQSVKAWNNEAERKRVCDFLLTEANRYQDWNGVAQTILAMIPSEAFVGEPLKIARAMNEAELLQARLQKQEEARRIEDEKESRSLIPLNPEYETNIFSSRNIDTDCDLIADLMWRENEYIQQLMVAGHYQEAALRFLQMTKSMCRHFIEDRHYEYYDDVYSPESVTSYQIEKFIALDKAGKLPAETKTFLSLAWQEIKDTECYQQYGIPEDGL